MHIFINWTFFLRISWYIVNEHISWDICKFLNNWWNYYQNIITNNITLWNAKDIYSSFRQWKFNQHMDYDAIIMQLYWNFLPYSSSVWYCKPYLVQMLLELTKWESEQLWFLICLLWCNPPIKRKEGPLMWRLVKHDHGKGLPALIHFNYL